MASQCCWPERVYLIVSWRGAQTRWGGGDWHHVSYEMSAGAKETQSNSGSVVWYAPHSVLGGVEVGVMVLVVVAVAVLVVVVVACRWRWRRRWRWRWGWRWRWRMRTRVVAMAVDAGA